MRRRRQQHAGQCLCERLSVRDAGGQLAAQSFGAGFLDVENGPLQKVGAPLAEVARAPGVRAERFDWRYAALGSGDGGNW